MNAVCISGMHRSGTSIAARFVQLLGVDLGDPELLMGPGPDNRAGYWENRAIKELDDALLAELGGSWDQPPLLEPGWQDDGALDGLRDRAREVLDRSFGPASRRPAHYGWKDPRLSLVLPFWRTVATVGPTVSVVRDPREVAASLHARNGLDESRVALLWLRYVYAAAADDPDQLCLDQRRFFTDLDATVQSLCAHLGLPAPSAAVVESLHRHVDPELRHHVEPAGWQSGPNPLLRLVDDVWNGGQLDLGLLAPPVRDALAQGWWRPPDDGEALATARAKVMKLQDTIRRRELHLAAIRNRGS